MLNNMVVLGSVNLDHVIHVEQFPHAGETVSGHSYQIQSGGKGANQAVAAAKLEADVEFIACIGDDDFSKNMRNQFSRAGVKTMGVKALPGYSTGTALINVNTATGENSITTSPEANNQLTFEQVNHVDYLIESTDALLVQLETPLEGVERAIDIAYYQKIFIALNPAPARKLSDSLLSKLDLITPNQTEAKVLTGVTVTDKFSAKEACSVLRNRGVKTVITTLGKKGIYVLSDKYDLYMPALSVEAVDTTAAGDCFNGALLAELHRTDNMLDAIRFAQAAAALSVTRAGAQNSIPSLCEVNEFIDALDERGANLYL